MSTPVESLLDALVVSLREAAAALEAADDPALEVALHAIDARIAELTPRLAALAAGGASPSLV
ncbi:MAG TPA: hypothetical protein VEA99_15540, partial [Gemmatimonadaceae bacterium]|nr:hypothetical protein [Gemmatimonadaceae bacterium]